MTGFRRGKEAAPLFIVRPAAEVATKSRRTRRRFERVLRGNLETALAEAGAAGAALRQDYGRLYVETDAQARGGGAAAPVRCGLVLTRGGRGTVRARRDRADRRPRVRRARVRGRTYAVRAKRFAPQVFSAQQVNERLGAALNPHATVDLDRPRGHRPRRDRPRNARTCPPTGGAGSGGLHGGDRRPRGRAPLGRLRFRGPPRGGCCGAASPSTTLLCNLGGGAYERLVLQVAKVLRDLWSAGQDSRLFVVDFTDVLADLRRAASPRLWQVVLKRVMYRAARRRRAGDRRTSHRHGRGP